VNKITTISGISDW